MIGLNQSSTSRKGEKYGTDYELCITGTNYRDDRIILFGYVVYTGPIFERQVYSVGTWPIGIFVCRIWVMTTASYATGQDVALEVFTAVVYGILVAGVST